MSLLQRSSLSFLNHPLRWSRGSKIFSVVLLNFVIAFILLRHYRHEPEIDENLPNRLYNPTWREPLPQLGNYSSKAIIAASIIGERTSWIPETFPDFEHYIYVNDDANATLTVPGQRGRESTTYLTYIIDHYNSLPDYMFFIQGERYQWHNEDRMYDGIPPILNFRLPHVDKTGYANLRCTWDAGCPTEIHPEPDAEKLWDPAWPWIYMPKLFALAFEAMFPGEKVPAAVGTPCCAQFVATRKAVHRRSRDDYIRYRAWLNENEIDPGTTGRVFEYMWQIVLRGLPVHCPPTPQCMCDQFGLCDLPQCTKKKCKGRFRPIPFYASLPKDWPDEGQGVGDLPREGWWEEELRRPWWRVW